MTGELSPGDDLYVVNDAHIATMHVALGRLVQLGDGHLYAFEPSTDSGDTVEAPTARVRDLTFAPAAGAKPRAGSTCGPTPRRGRGKSPA